MCPDRSVTHVPGLYRVAVSPRSIRAPRYSECSAITDAPSMETIPS
jgi:hypothetical protein